MLVSLIETELPVTGLHVNYSRAQVTSHLQGLLNSDGVQGMLEGKDHQIIYILFHLFLYL